jgi:branched-chain amino acid transport system ATP-binding protein
MKEGTDRSGDPILQIEDLSINFGGLQALLGFTTSVFQGEIRGIIGPNGAGKTTLFNLMSRFYKPSRGKILFDHQDVMSCKPHQIIALGISRTFQRSELFNSMTALENVLMGLHIYEKTGLLSAAMQFNRMKEEERQSREKAEKILEMLELQEFLDTPVNTLPFGQQRLLDIGRAIVSHPRLLLLDEPAAGMSYAGKVRLAQLLLQIREQLNLTILLVEHDMKMVMSISDRLTVLNYGKIIAEGKPAEIRDNSAVIEAYLGKRKG